MKFFKKSLVALLLLMTSLHVNAEPTKIIRLIEIIPTDNSDYTISLEKRQIQTAAQIASSKLKDDKNCKIQLEEFLGTGSEKDLTERIREKIKDPENSVVVGLSRTNFARSAALSTKDTGIRVISVGASSGDLKRINDNFITVVNPVSEQLNKIKDVMLASECNRINTLGSFDISNYLSTRLLTDFKQLGLGSIDVSKDLHGKNLQKIKCIFIGKNLNDAMSALEVLRKSKWKGLVLGTGDWNIYSKELEELSKRFPQTVKFVVPTGWLPEVNPNSVKFNKAFRSMNGDDASPLAAYVHDGILLAREVLCKNKKFSESIKVKGLLKSYQQINDAGNMISPMYVREIYGKL